MHKRIATLFLLLFLFAVRSALASHIYGADFYYQYISGNQYKVTLAVYGDCKGDAFPNLDGATPTIQLYDGSSLYLTRNLSQDGAGVEVTPVCERELNNTTCKSLINPISGVTRFTYSAIVSVPYNSANWRFHFDGAMPKPGGGQNGAAGRSYDLSNIINTQMTPAVMALDARLNNVPGPNSTAQFTTIPTPFYCINVAQQYNHGAVDPNLDSLDYALVPGLSRGGATVTYSSSYSGTLPMNGATSSWTFNNLTGQLDFTPTVADKFLVVNEVKEYRNGVLVGTSMREMTFVILASCNNTPSVSNLDTAGTFKTGLHISNNEVIICQTKDTAQFAIVPTNKAGDTITASVSGLPSGVSYTIYSNNTPRPVVVVNWLNARLNAGSYNFFVTYRDRGCPLTSQQTKAFTLRVVAPNELAAIRVLAPTQCAHRALVRMAATAGLVPRTITVRQNGVVIFSYRDSTGNAFADSLGSGTYIVTIQSDLLDCPTERSIVVVDSGVYPNVPLADDQFYCLNDVPVQIRVRADSGAMVRWYQPDGTPLGGAPSPATHIAGRWFYLISQQVKVCESKKDTVWLYVTKRPVADISGASLRCEFDTGTYVFSGSVGEGPILEYVWSWGGAFYHQGDGAGPWKAIWGLGGKKLVTLQVLENKCPSLIDTLEVEVKPRPFAGFEMQTEACRLDTVLIRYNTTRLPGQEFAWSFSGASLADAAVEGPFNLAWNSAGVKRVSLTTSLDGCADTRFRDVTIHPTPEVAIGNKPGPVCIGDKIYLLASGADRYTWRPADSLRSDAGGVYAQVLKPSRYTVMGANEWACMDSASVDYPVVEACCSFGYPDAFTPNGDGRNDKFNAVSYGNHLEYELSIYNRWGQRVYYGHEAAEGWDGTFGGKPCDAGTYYYYLNALCYTGHREVRKGDVILIR